jgi:hypothetical protein
VRNNETYNESRLASSDGQNNHKDTKSTKRHEGNAFSTSLGLTLAELVEAGFDKLSQRKS